jgi:Galactose oxidase, central domain
MSRTEEESHMIPSNTAKLALLIGLAFLMTACSGLKETSTSGSSTTFTISGSVTGLTGSGLVLQDNGSDNLSISGTGTVKFTFKTAVTGAYVVTVLTQPTNPAQTCTVSNGSGTATADVTNVQVACSNVYTVSGTVSGLTGSGLVLADNTSDTLAITGTGTVQFTFKGDVTGAYNVTVQTQPTNPTQTCTVTNGSGTATANVTNVQVSCASKFTVGGTVTGLTGSGLVLTDNGTDTLPITGTGSVPFTFKTQVPGAYNVTVQTQPTNPTQTCVVTNGAGTATTNVTSVQVTCSSGFTIGGTVSGLNGSGLVLADNTSDTLSITGTGSIAFTFKSLVSGTYNVTVQTQPSNPAQNCIVTSGSGTASAAVTNVQVTCGAVYTIGGNVSGLLGSGLVLLDTVGSSLSQLTVTGTGAVPFTFATPAPANSSYAVSVVTQPTNPSQNCSVTNGTGTATGSVNTVQVVCTAPEWTIGGTLVGLVSQTYTGTPLNGDTVELINNGGDNTLVTGNNQGFTFPTPVTNNGQYNVNVFVQPTSQPQGCTAFYYEGVATANVDSVIIDCQHNDWTWMFGPDTNGTLGPYGIAQLPPPIAPAQDTNTPGGREYGVTWTDSAGRKWMFGGWGMPVTGVSPPLLPYLMDDLWVFVPGLNGGAGQTGSWVPANLPITTMTSTSGGVTTITNTPSTVPLQTTGGYSSVTSTFATGTNTTTTYPGGPGARWGSVSWTDSTGNLYLFGGQGFGASYSGFLNDLWKFTPTQYDVSYSTASIIYSGSYEYSGSWTNISGYSNSNAAANYGTQGTSSSSNLPGARWGAAYCTDANGTVWMFGGQGYDSSGNVGLLNDLWMYSGGVWTWVGPSNSNLSQNDGVYGTLGTAATGNAPGGRQTAVLLADNQGNLWLFGGLGLDSKGTQNPGNTGSLPSGSTPEGALLNDLWEYNISSGEWTWVSGGGATGLANQVGVYGTQQVPATGFFPGSRWSSAGWSDANGNLWISGGWGYASALAQSTGFLNDIWEFHPATGLWTWWRGSSNVNQAGNYPTYLPVQYGVPFVNNQPGGRSGVLFWPQQQGAETHVWAFGGQGYDSTGANGYLGDLWKYLPFPY